MRSIEEYESQAVSEQREDEAFTARMYTVLPEIEEWLMNDAMDAWEERWRDEREGGL